MKGKKSSIPILNVKMMKNLKCFQNRLEPPQTTGPKIFSNVDMARIPTQFRRGNWQELMPDLVDKIKSIKPEICGEKFYPYKFLSYGKI
jgi:hypothetical protein